MRALAQSLREPAFAADPFPFYAHAREAGPFFRWQEYGLPCEAVNAVLRDRRFRRESPGGRGERPAQWAASQAFDHRSMRAAEAPRFGGRSKFPSLEPLAVRVG